MCFCSVALIIVHKINCSFQDGRRNHNPGIDINPGKPKGGSTSFQRCMAAQTTCSLYWALFMKTFIASVSLQSLQSKGYGGKEKEMLDGKIKHLQSGYARLVNLSKTLKCKLEEVVEKTDYMTVTEEMDVIRKNLYESIKWFQNLSECDDFEKWIVEKKKYLESTEPDAEVAKRNFETFLTDFADSNNQIGRIDGMVKKFDGCDVKMMEAVVARGERVKKGYKELLVC